MITLLREVSFRHFRHSPVRTGLVLFGIALGVSMQVATSAVNESLLSSFTESVDQVAGRADLVVTAGDVGVPAEIVDEISKVRGVAHVAGSLEIISQRRTGGGPLLVLGVDFVGDRYFLPFETSEGQDVVEDPLEFINDPTAILISKKLSERDHLAIGGAIDLVTSEGPKVFSIRGILDDRGPVSTFGGQVAVMFSEAAQMMFSRGDRYDRIDVALSPGTDPRAMLEQISRTVGDRGRVEEPEGRAQHLSAIIGPFKIGIQAAGFIALIVGMFLIYNAVSVAVVQRRREIGILRALGVPRGQVVMLFALEAILLGFVGSLFGLGLAQLIAEGSLGQAAPNVSQFYRPIQPPPPRISWELAAVGVFGGVLTTLFAALGPAISASRVDPVETLRRSRGTGGMRQLPARKMLIGAAIAAAISFAFSMRGSADLLPGFLSMVFLVVSAVLALPAFVLTARRVLVGPIEVVFGIPGRLAIDNIERSLGRSVLTVAALMVAVGCSITAGTWGESLEKSMLAWLDQAVPADILVTAGSPFADQHNIPFKSSMMDKLEGIEGVEALQPGRMINQDLGPVRLQLLSLDSRAYHHQIAKKGRALEVVEGEPIGLDDLFDAPRIVVSENAANRLGLHPKDEVTFRTPTGGRKFEVRAVIIDYSSDQGFAYIDRKYFREWWEDDLVDTMDLYLLEGASVDSVVAEVRRRLGNDASLFVTPAAKLREEIRKVLLQSLAVLRSSDFVTLVVALLGVIGTMLAAVIDRIREIGVLRAVGATRKQVLAAVVTESAFLGVASVVSGTLFGVPLGMIFVHVITLASTGWRVDYAFPVMLAVQMGVAVIGTSAIAGLLPGRHAAGLDVTEALAYE